MDLLTGIGEIATLAPLAAEGRCTGITDEDLGRHRDGWLAWDQDKVVAAGTGPVPSEVQAQARSSHDAEGGLVLPGLVDSHTHPLFAGCRADEFARRLAGQSYQQIAAAGGGIQSTVKATREASDDELRQLCNERLRKMARLGVTTVEVKSGYGLSAGEELRHLRLLGEVREAATQTIKITCLAAHAIPPGKSADAFIDECCQEILPQVGREGLAEAADIFIEAGYFRREHGARYGDAARAAGLDLRIHAEEFTRSGGCSLAAELGALSADHLQFATAEDAAAMAKAGVTATLLPGTSLYTAIPFTQAAPFRKAGCAIALASDFNPGSCVLYNLPALATYGAIHAGLSVAETIAAVTYVPACSLRLGDQVGALAPGYRADFALWPQGSVESWLAAAGQEAPKGVWCAGRPL